MNNPEKKFDFWNDHSLEFLEMAMKRDHQERVTNARGFGRAQRECGDTIEFYLMADKGQLTAVSYDIKGCLFSHACANALIHLVRGMEIKKARTIGEEDVISFLKTLPEKEHHCARLALDSFSMALDSLENN